MRITKQDRSRVGARSCGRSDQLRCLIVNLPFKLQVSHIQPGSVVGHRTVEEPRRRRQNRLGLPTPQPPADLLEIGNEDAGGYRDATPNRAHGTGTSLTPQSRVEGMIGKAQTFDGESDYITVSRESRFDFTTALTVSVWVKVAVFSKSFHTIMAKGDDAWRLQRDHNNSFLEFACDTTGYRHVSGTVGIDDSQWHYLTGVFDNKNISLYVDGVLDNSLEATDLMVTNDIPVWIGNNSGLGMNNRHFNGIIDEVRVAGVSRSKAWITLSYANQKEKNSLITIE